ncbi:unnamed protein product [Cochlearia groenlandica]
MESRTTIQETKHEEEEESDESSIFSTILADIEENPTILLQKQNTLLSGQVSIFSTFFDKKLKKTRGRESKGDFSCTVPPQTLTHSNLIDILKQELEILKSETKTKENDRLVSCNPRGSDCVREGKVEEMIKFLADEVNTETSNDVVFKVEDGDILANLDEMLSNMVGDENVDNCEIDEFIEKLLEKIEKDGTYLDLIKDDYVFGWLLEDLLRDRLIEKETDSWVSNGKPEEEEIKDIKKESPMKLKTEKKKTEEEPILTKRDYLWCKRRFYLIEKLREREENLTKKRAKAVRFGVEFSFLVSECMFLVPREALLSEIEEYWMCLRRLGVDGDGKGTSIIIGKLQEVFEIVIMKKENIKDHNVNLPETVFRFPGFIPLCVDAIQILGKIVWSMRRNQSERLKLYELDTMFEDGERVLMKMELKLVEMKQRMYRSVSADYESFSKSERFDSLLGRKIVKRVNGDNGFRRSVIGSCLVVIWKSLFQTEV